MRSQEINQKRRSPSHRNGRHSVTRLFMLVSMLVPMSQNFAQNPAALKAVHVVEDDTQLIYELVCDGAVRFATIYNDLANQLRLFLHGVGMPPDPESILQGRLRRNVTLTLVKESPPVLQVGIAFPRKLPYEVDSARNRIRITVRKEGGQAPAAAPAKKAPLDSISTPRKSEESTLLQKLSTGARITIDFRGADIGNVLRVLARQNGLNIVASDSVRGEITVSLKNVTVEQALESILRANGYKYIIENGVIVVKPVRAFRPADMESRVFRLRYIDAHNVYEAITDLRSREGNVKVLTASFHNRKDVYDVNDKTEHQREQKYWLRSSVLVVTDFPANLEAIAELIQELDRPVHQVMIEARLVETSPLQAQNLGIDWSKSIAAEIFNQVALPGGDIYRYSSQSPLPNKDRRITFGTLNTSQFNAVLNYLQSKMNTRLVSNPRILAMDNEPSDISVGTKFPIPQITRGVGGQGDIVTFDYRDIDIKLRVIPHVTDSSTITMYVNPIIEEITGEVTVDRNTAPITSKREVDTVVKVRDGETIVIGGMIKEREVVSVNKVWLLGDIPLLGHLFRNKTSERRQSDLLIFITPQIVR